ncbi:MAG TPA: DUF4105 domain-containing protein [Gemmatimonas sp.]|uniref:lipoprotein N-acyltransferase Lnb domain-containing protein n=1 Tax=Gemmatimonas sp. TaxID=1962908 RepID=UPI002EDAED6B
MRVGTGRGMWRATLALLAGLVACSPAGPADNVPATAPPPALGESAVLDSARASRGESLEVAVYTYGPGNAIFERFGHIALAVHDRTTGEDVAFNWGMFDFNQPNFLARFLTGDTKYWMVGYRTDQFNAAYQGEDRTIRKQIIALSPAQRGALYDFLAWNAQEQNKYYRYDYYRDNCSTRVRDALDWAMSGALKPALSTTSGHHTWRDETARITASDLPVYAGIEIALGRNADAHLDAWGESFLPERLADHLAAAQVAGAAVVQQDSVIYTAQRAPLPNSAPNRLWAGAAFGLLLAALVVLLARAAGHGATMAGTTLSIFGVTWYLVGGVVGTALLLAATVTKHAPYMGSNLSLLLFNPLLLLTAVLWPWRASVGRTGRAVRGLSAVCAVFALIALVLMHLPGFSQGSMLVVFAVLPVHVALAWAAQRLTAPATRT